jgi:hypothetical protein
MKILPAHASSKTNNTLAKLTLSAARSIISLVSNSKLTVPLTKMAATTRKHKSAHASAKSKKATVAEVDGANDGAAEVDAKAGASEGLVVNTPISSAADAAGPPPLSAVGVDNETALTTMITAMNGEDEDANAVVMMTTMTTSATDEYSPLPARGGGAMMPPSTLTRPPTPTMGRLGRRVWKLQGRTARRGHLLC